MALRHEIDKLNKVLKENLAKADFKSFRRNVALFQKRFKDVLTAQDKLQLQNVLGKIAKMEKPRATYYEFLLFLAVVILILLIFGEDEELEIRVERRRSDKKFLKNTFFKIK